MDLKFVQVSDAHSAAALLRDAPLGAVGERDLSANERVQVLRSERAGEVLYIVRTVRQRDRAVISGYVRDAVPEAVREFCRLTGQPVPEEFAERRDAVECVSDPAQVGRQKYIAAGGTERGLAFTPAEVESLLRTSDMTAVGYTPAGQLVRVARVQAQGARVVYGGDVRDAAGAAHMSFTRSTPEDTAEVFRRLVSGAWVAGEGGLHVAAADCTVGPTASVPDCPATWTDASRREIPISELSGTHLNNTIRMLDRRGVGLLAESEATFAAALTGTGIGVERAVRLLTPRVSVYRALVAEREGRQRAGRWSVRAPDRAPFERAELECHLRDVERMEKIKASAGKGSAALIAETKDSHPTRAQDGGNEASDAAIAALLAEDGCSEHSTTAFAPARAAAVRELVAQRQRDGRCSRHLQHDAESLVLALRLVEERATVWGGSRSDRLVCAWSQMRDSRACLEAPVEVLEAYERALDPTLLRERRRREIDEVLREDVAAHPRYAVARAAAVRACCERADGGPPAREVQHLLECLRAYEDDRGGGCVSLDSVAPITPAFHAYRVRLEAGDTTVPCGTTWRTYERVRASHAAWSST